jgi:hypothetical protein
VSSKVKTPPSNFEDASLRERKSLIKNLIVTTPVYKASRAAAPSRASASL